MKLTDPQRLEVATFCISYLFEKFPNERGLFRSSVSQTDVRNLQGQLAQHSVKPREDLDPHLVAEVLQTTFRDLNSPLMYEIYKDMLAAELVDEDYDANKELVQTWLLKIPDSKYTIVNSLFRLLARVASFEDSESSLMQLTSSVTPTICRPLSSSYMSIRHMEDLKKLRPVIAFFIENYLDLFNIVRTASTKLSTSESPSIDLSVPSLDRSNSVSETASMIVDSSTKEGSEESKSRSNDAAFARPNLLVMIPSVNPNAMDTSHDSDTDSEKSVGSSYSDNEWRILMALVSLKVGNYLELPEKDLQQSVIRESTGDAHHSIMQAYAAKQAAAAQAKLDAVASSSSPNNTILAPILPNSTPILTKSHARRSHRRKMVSECKGLRAQIFEFEQDFFKAHNRAPKGQERGNMNPVYIKYRELKREIRDAAAKDIQRVIRGYRCRQRLKKSKSINNDLKEGLSSANYELLVRFRDLLEQKKDLKKKLKKFDEDFYVQHGRAPKKSDKEVIRPMYQKYHEIKGNIDSMRKLLVANNIPLPEDVDDNVSRSNGGGQSKSPSTTNLDTDTDNESKGRPLGNFGNANYATSDDEGGETSGRGKGGSSGDAKEDSNLSALLQEKKNLHAYLKVYERDFNRIHGRPVMKNEDILPVANEYQRYKELKAIIKDMKA